MVTIGTIDYNGNKKTSSRNNNSNARYPCVKCWYPCGTLLGGGTKYCSGCEDWHGKCNESLRIVNNNTPMSPSDAVFTPTAGTMPRPAGTVASVTFAGKK